MTNKRKVDKLAGKGSLADRLRKRRIAYESGQPENATQAFTENTDLNTQTKPKGPGD